MKERLIEFVTAYIDSMPHQSCVAMYKLIWQARNEQSTFQPHLQVLKAKEIEKLVRDTVYKRQDCNVYRGRGIYKYLMK